MRRHDIRWGLALAATLLMTVAGLTGLALAHDNHDDGGKRAWLGVALGEKDGVVSILSVMDDSPAEAAGLQAGDVVTAIDGKPVSDTDAFISRFRDYRPGDSPALTVRRDGEEIEVRPVLEEKSGRFMFMMPNIEIPEVTVPFFNVQPGEGGDWQVQRRGYLGVQLQSITDELREYFGASAGEGILVSRVMPDSPAAKAGLKAGDVITGIDGNEVDSQGDLLEGLADLNEGDPVQIEVIRKGRIETFTVNVEVKEAKSWQFRFQCDEGDDDCQQIHIAPFGEGHGGLRFMQDPEWQHRLQERMQDLQERLERFKPEVVTTVTRT